MVEASGDVRRHPRKRVVYWVTFWIVMLLISSLILSLAGVVFVGTSVGLGISSKSWGGYTVTSSILNPQPTVMGVSGSWVVPRVSVSPTDTFSAVWLGIGGQFEKSLIQVGTEQDSVNGSTYYLAWYELLPDYSVTINTVKIAAGDAISASIAIVDSASNLWSISIKDETNGQHFQQNVHYASSMLSAEWIVERPTVGNEVTSLALFGQVTFTNLSAKIGNVAKGIDSFTFLKVTMRDSQNNPLVSVSAFSGQSSSSFNVNYLKSS